jgi:hypothetical protein
MTRFLRLFLGAALGVHASAAFSTTYYNFNWAPPEPPGFSSSATAVASFWGFFGLNSSILAGQSFTAQDLVYADFTLELTDTNNARFSLADIPRSAFSGTRLLGPSTSVAFTDVFWQNNAAFAGCYAARCGGMPDGSGYLSQSSKQLFGGLSVPNPGTLKKVYFYYDETDYKNTASLAAFSAYEIGYTPNSVPPPPPTGDPVNWLVPAPPTLGLIGLGFTLLAWQRRQNATGAFRV